MPFLAFLSEAVLVSLSGVMSPGPITAVAVGKGSRSPHAGALVAIGHGLAEWPLMVAVYLGIGRVLDRPAVTAAIGLVGGIVLLVMAIGMLRSARQAQVGLTSDGRSPLVAGILVSLGSPYFFVWWATVGAALILRSVAFGVWGFLALALSHWLCDLVWDYFLSALSYKGGQFLGGGFQRAVFALTGTVLLCFGVRLLVDATRTLLV
jgi:threonine/homoserine/homoserine lactone efflux protein